MDQPQQQDQPPALLMQQDKPEVVSAKRMIADASLLLSRSNDPLEIDKRRRYCPSCAKVRPKQLFVRQARANRPGARFDFCLSCRNRMRRERKEAKEESIRRKATQIAIKEILRGHSRSGVTISDIGNALIRRFGGVDGFVAEWYTELQKTRITPNVSRRVVNDMYRDVSKVVSDASAAMKATQSMDTMTGDEIAMLFEAQSARLIASHPVLLEKLAEEMGYQKVTAEIEPAPVAAEHPGFVHAPEPEFSI